MKMFRDLKRIFGKVGMPWKRVIATAIISGVAAGLINVIPFFANTSLDDAAHNLEVWIVLAIWITSNAESAKEAAWKVFVFFLISQPLVYLAESPFYGLHVFDAYPYWFLMTLLTWPAGYAAWYIGRESWLGVLALFGADALLIAEGTQYLWTALNQFPRQVLAVIFCYGSAILLLLIFYSNKKRFFILTAAEIPVLLLCMNLGYITQESRKIIETARIPDQPISFSAPAWRAAVDHSDFYHIAGIEGSYVKVSAFSNAPVPATVTCKSTDGQTYKFTAEIQDGKLVLSRPEPVDNSRLS